MLVTHPVRHRQQVEQEGCGDVVRQVADHPQLGTGSIGQRSKVHRQCIGLDHADTLTLTPASGQVAVQLDHRQAAAALQHRLGQGTQAGTDLHQRFTRLGGDGAHDGVNHAAVGQEVLAEALARGVRHQGCCAVGAITAAAHAARCRRAGAALWPSRGRPARIWPRAVGHVPARAALWGRPCCCAAPPL